MKKIFFFAPYVAEFIGTFFLVFFGCMAIILSQLNIGTLGEIAGMAIGLTVTICALVAGPLTGASMNPARSLGPALLSGNLSQLWIYILAPVVGACLGALAYEWIRCNNNDPNAKHGCC